MDNNNSLEDITAAASVPRYSIKGHLSLALDEEGKVTLHIPKQMTKRAAYKAALLDHAPLEAVARAAQGVAEELLGSEAAGFVAEAGLRARTEAFELTLDHNGQGPLCNPGGVIDSAALKGAKIKAVASATVRAKKEGRSDPDRGAVEERAEKAFLRRAHAALGIVKKYEAAAMAAHLLAEAKAAKRAARTLRKEAMGEGRPLSLVEREAVEGAEVAIEAASLMAQ
ncbi:hypothetical protein [Bacteriophage sp.]|nr:hypothetical protein [Bacteriophage sp.]UOF80106.1 hypothetical protein [Bacteriophage sp.]